MLYSDTYVCVCVCCYALKDFCGGRCVSLLSSHTVAMCPISQEQCRTKKMQNMMDEGRCVVKNGYVKETGSLEWFTLSVSPL